MAYTVEQIKSLTYNDILKMSEKELREAARVAVSASNKRLKRLEESGLESPALRSRTTVKKFGIRDKNLQQVRSELNSMIKFLNSKTSTVRGARKFNVKMSKLTGSDKGYNYTTDSEFWGAVDKMKEMYRGVIDSDQIVSAVREAREYSFDNKELEKNASKLTTKKYEAKQLELRKRFKV